MRYFWIMMAVVMFSACQTIEPVNSASTPNLVQIKGERATYAETKACEYVGGQVQRAGMLGFDMCVIPYSDGGMICRDSAHCQGQCRTDNFDAYGKQVTGQCQINNSPFGCYAEVRNGIGEPALCVD